MPSIYKVLGQTVPAANTQTAVYTVPAATQAVISTINVCNISGSNALFRIAVQVANASLTNAQYIAYDTALPSNDAIAITTGLTLGNSDVISVYATQNVSFSVFGSQIT